MSRAIRTAAGIAAATVIVAAVLVLAPGSGGGPAPAASTAAGERLDADPVVAGLQRKLRERPGDPALLAQLGLAFEQRARETRDAAYYDRAEAALRQATAAAPDNDVALGGLGSLALSRHQFEQALELGQRARALAPGTTSHLAVIGDALIELGRYREAFATMDRLVALRPGLAAYARVAQAQALLGRPQAAIEAWGLALEAARGRGEPEAWAHAQLGALLFAEGRPQAAAAQQRAALAIMPRLASALDGLARATWAQGRRTEAVRLARRALEAGPEPLVVARVAELLDAAGDRAGARAQRAEAMALLDAERRRGVRTALEEALLRADNRVRPAETVALARSGRRERPSVEGDDVLGWALTRAGRCREALPHARRALRLGSRDAAKVFHLAMAQRCAGQPAAARASARRALRINPHFSVRWAPVARRLARG